MLLNRENYILRNRKAYNLMASIYKERRERDFTKICEEIKHFSDILYSSFTKPYVLEIGPGAGIILNYLNKRGFKTTAIDFSDEMIKVAREYAPETNFINDNFLSHDFDNCCFEGVIAKSVIHLFTIEDTKYFLSKIKKILVYGGYAYISSNIRRKSDEGDFKIKKMGDRTFVRFKKDWTFKELEEIILNTPFNIVSSIILKEKGVAKFILLNR